MKNVMIKDMKSTILKNINISNHNNNRNNTKKLNNISRKSFFIKYLIRNNYIHIESNDIKNLKRNTDINLNELLNEKNIKLSYYDIFTDYKYFRKDYYFFNPNHHQNYVDKFKTENEKNPKIQLPFDEKNITLSKALKYIFISQSPLDLNVQYLKIFFFFLAIVFYYDYKRNHVRRINESFYNKYKENTSDINLTSMKV